MKTIDITIKQIQNKEGEYIAYVQSGFLAASFAVCFQDNIFGSVALSSFYEMIQHKYDDFKINFVISNERFSFKNPALYDLLSIHRPRMVNK
jgi:hypothetical protein